MLQMESLDLSNSICSWDAVSCHLCWDCLPVVARPALTGDAEFLESGGVVPPTPASWSRQMKSYDNPTLSQGVGLGSGVGPMAAIL